MSQLLEQLRKSQAIDGKALESAMRRQQIYGGSLDTILSRECSGLRPGEAEACRQEVEVEAHEKARNANQQGDESTQALRALRNVIGQS